MTRLWPLLPFLFLAACATTAPPLPPPPTAPPPPGLSRLIGIDAAAVTEIARQDSKAAIEVVQYWRWLDAQSKELKPWSNQKAA